jgi:hypothetical protein
MDSPAKLSFFSLEIHVYNVGVIQGSNGTIAVACGSYKWRMEGVYCLLYILSYSRSMPILYPHQ